MKEYRIIITASLFGTAEDFYRMFADGNRRVVIENVEFEGNLEDDKNPQHVTGFIEQKIEASSFLELDISITHLIRGEGLIGECFGVYDYNDLKCEKELYTEDNFKI